MIISARAIPPPSFALASRRPRGSRRAGLAFEHAVAKALPGALHGQWLAYSRHGRREAICQPDIIARIDGALVVIEVKLSYTEAAWSQLELYRAVLSRVKDEPVRGLVICRHLNTRRAAHGDIREALALNPRRPVVHWLGYTPLLTQ